MLAEHDNSEWSQLFIAKADGSISREEHERLAALLKESAEARKQWFVFQDVEAGLFNWAQGERESAHRA